MRKLLRRIVILVPAVILQLVWLRLLFTWLSPWAGVISFALSNLSLLVVLYITIRLGESTYKVLWLLVVLTFPLPGTALYLCFGNKRTGKVLEKKLSAAKLPAPTENGCREALASQRLRLAQTVGYLENMTGASLCRSGEIRYFHLGEQMLPAMLAAMEGAAQSIYLEYFIIEPGLMWNSMTEIMARKAAQGVDVRVIYDDLGSISTFSKSDAKALEARGIRCLPFNPLIFVKGTLNYRDHRKMLIVDGKKSYGYLPKSVKKTVDEVVDRLEELPVVKQCYDQWCVLQSEVENYYHDKPRERKKLSQEKEFRQIKNAVIQEAERIRLGEITFEEADLTGHDEPEQVRGESYACWELRQIIRDASLPLADWDGAAEELERLADWGDPHAQYLMGQLCRDGPLLIPDSLRAKHWLTQAAKRNLPESQYALGKLLLSDDLEIRDPDEGIRWLKQAAENGNHFAAYRLGKEYLKGEVMHKDSAKAVELFTRSAKAGNQYAQYLLGKLYLTGQGVTRDQAQSVDWFSRSAAQGNQYAQFFLERQSDLHPPSVMLAATHLLYHMSRIFENHSLPQSSAGLHIDRKRRQQLREKRIALGHKPNDHEEEQSQGMTMKGW